MRTPRRCVVLLMLRVSRVAFVPDHIKLVTDHDKFLARRAFSNFVLTGVCFSKYVHSVFG